MSFEYLIFVSEGVDRGQQGLIYENTELELIRINCSLTNICNLKQFLINPSTVVMKSHIRKIKFIMVGSYKHRQNSWNVSYTFSKYWCMVNAYLFGEKKILELRNFSVAHFFFNIVWVLSLKHYSVFKFLGGFTGTCYS